MNTKSICGEKKAGDNKWLIAWSVIIGLVTYFMLYSDFLTNPDGMFVGGGVDLSFSSNWERSLGRWMLPVLDDFRGGVSAPLFKSVLCLLFLSLSMVLIFSLFSFAKGKCIRLLISATLLCNPAVLTLLTYFYCSAEYAFAFFLAVASIWLVIRLENKLGIIIAAILIMLSLSIYQAYIGVAMAVAIEYVVLKAFASDENSKEQKLFCEIGRMTLAGLLGIVLYYFIVLPLVLHIYGIQMADYKGADSLSVTGIIFALPHSIATAYRDFFDYFFANSIAKNPFGIKMFSAGIIGIGLIAAVVKIFVCKNIKVRVKLLVVAALIILPLCANAIDLLNPSTQINMLTSGGMLTIVPFFLVLSISILSEQKQTVLKDGLLVFVFLIACALLWAYQLSVNTDMMYLKRAKDQSRAFANRICWELEDEYQYHSNGDKKIFISGVLKEGNYSLESLYRLNDKVNEYIKWGDVWNTFENSLIGWDQVMMQYTGVELNMCTAEEAKEIVQTEQYQQMPNYPDEGAIQEINEIIVVKVSDVTSWISYEVE